MHERHVSYFHLQIRFIHGFQAPLLPDFRLFLLLSLFILAFLSMSSLLFLPHGKSLTNWFTSSSGWQQLTMLCTFFRTTISNIREFESNCDRQSTLLIPVARWRGGRYLNREIEKFLQAMISSHTFEWKAGSGFICFSFHKQNHYGLWEAGIFVHLWSISIAWGDENLTHGYTIIRLDT